MGGRAQEQPACLCTCCKCVNCQRRNHLLRHQRNSAPELVEVRHLELHTGSAVGTET